MSGNVREIRTVHTFSETLTRHSDGFTGRKTLPLVRLLYYFGLICLDLRCACVHMKTRDRKGQKCHDARRMLLVHCTYVIDDDIFSDSASSDFRIAVESCAGVGGGSSSING